MVKSTLVVIDVLNSTKIEEYFPRNFLNSVIEYSKDFDDIIVVEYGGKFHDELFYKLGEPPTVVKRGSDGSSVLIKHFDGNFPSSITLVGCYLGCCVAGTAQGLLKATQEDLIPRTTQIIINPNLCDLLSLDTSDNSCVYTCEKLNSLVKYDNFHLIMNDNLSIFRMNDGTFRAPIVENNKRLRISNESVRL